MNKEEIILIKQLVDSLEKKIKSLESNDLTVFQINEIKKSYNEVESQLGEMLK